MHMIYFKVRKDYNNIHVVSNNFFRISISGCVFVSSSFFDPDKGLAANALDRAALADSCGKPGLEHRPKPSEFWVLLFVILGHGASPMAIPFWGG